MSQGGRIPFFDGGGELGEGGVKGLQGGEDFGAIGEKNFGPESGGAGGDAGGIAVARAGQGEGSGARGENQGGGEAVGQVTDEGDLGVVLGGGHREHAGAEGFPERGSITNCVG